MPNVLKILQKHLRKVRIFVSYKCFPNDWKMFVTTKVKQTFVTNIWDQFVKCLQNSICQIFWINVCHTFVFLKHLQICPIYFSQTLSHICSHKPSLILKHVQCLPNVSETFAKYLWKGLEYVYQFCRCILKDKSNISFLIICSCRTCIFLVLTYLKEKPILKRRSSC